MFHHRKGSAAKKKSVIVDGTNTCRMRHTLALEGSHSLR